MRNVVRGMLPPRFSETRLSGAYPGPPEPAGELKRRYFLQLLVTDKGRQ
jgi:hypothetical protein